MSTRGVPKNRVQPSSAREDEIAAWVATAALVAFTPRTRLQPGEPVGSPHVERDVRDVLSSRWGMLA